MHGFNELRCVESKFRMTNQHRRLVFEVSTFALLLMILGLVLIARVPEVVASRLTAYAFFDPLVDLRDKVMRFYVTEPDEQKMLDGALTGMIATLDDPYTNYFTPKQLASFEKVTTGTFSGIGAEIEVRDRQLRIVTPLEDSPAFKAGILAGDVIVEINSESTENLTVEEAVEKITGPEGTNVVLKLRHPNGDEVDITITRRKIEIETVRGFRRTSEGHWDYMLDPQAKVGYIRLAQFSAPTYKALVDALDALRQQGMRGLVLDLRYNPGGLLESAIQISDLFLDKGVVVSTKGRGGAHGRIINATADGTLPPFPIVVLVNEGSASASEIVSGALKDNGRAIILGTRTVGKGSVQELMKLDGEAGAVKLTTNYYYLPSGRNINRHDDKDVWGVDPTDGYYVPMSVDQREQMIKVRRDGDIIKPDNGESNGASQVTPEWLADTLKDIQLGAALKTMLAKLNGGEFVAVGKSNATLLAYITERDALTRRREMHEERITAIDKEVARLNGLIAAPEGESKPADEADADAGETKPHVDVIDAPMEEEAVP